MAISKETQAMYCPECGNDAADANFCPECGAGLAAVSDARVCPACGTDAGDANYCPECGTRLAKSGRGGGRPAPGDSRTQRPRAQRRGATRQGPTPPPRSGTPVALIWGAFALVAIVVVAVVVVVGGGGGAGGTATPSGGETVAADTSGSYSELVARGNDLYDKGIEAFNADDATAGEQSFRAAAEVYRAAWDKQPGDPSVGTDLAVALFYSRHHDEALQHIETVLEGTPDFQPAHLNKGIFLQTESEEAQGNGETGKAARFLEQAKTAFEKVVELDAQSDSGQRAAEILKTL